MKTLLSLLLLLALASCINERPADREAGIEGTWKLLTGTVIEGNDTSVTHYTGPVSFIKIINKTHFAFLQHDLNKGKDSAAVFVAGGGPYTLEGSTYTEHLEYCSAPEWEGNSFTFNVEIKGDTLVQSGTEKIEGLSINRINTEKYIRVRQHSAIQ